MDSKQMKIAAVAAVLVIVVAAVAVYFVTKDKDNGSDESKVTFLIQDNVGVYFWAEGNGDTVLDALKDACNDYDIKFVASNKDGVDTGIQSLFGLEMKADEAGNWSWWTQYGYTNNAWETSVSYMNELKSKDNAYFALVYGDGKVAPLVDPSQAKVWKNDYNGTAFLIQSESGMQFYINGEGKTVLDAFKDAASTYAIPNVLSKDGSGVEYGIDSLFGISYKEVTPGVYYYWAQFQYDKDTGKLTLEQSFMNNILSADRDFVAIIFGTGEA